MKLLKLNDTNSFRRTAAGLCLILGPLLVFGGLLTTPPQESSAQADYLASLSGSPILAQISAILLYFGHLLIAVGIFGMIHLLRRRAVVLGHVGGALALLGWLTLPGFLVTDFYNLSLAESLDPQQAVAVSNRAGAYPGAIIVFLAIPLGLLGLVLLCGALWRAGFAPVWVPIFVFVGFVVLFNFPAGVLSAAIGGILPLAGLGYIGLKILRFSDEDWERGTVPVDKSPGIA